MAYAASTGNNTWEVPRYGDPSNTLIDGLAGTDRLSFERLPRSRFLITQNADTGLQSAGYDREIQIQHHE